MTSHERVLMFSKMVFVVTEKRSRSVCTFEDQGNAWTSAKGLGFALGQHPFGQRFSTVGDTPLRVRTLDTGSVSC